MLPAAATTTMPAFHACSTAKASGSTWYGCVEFVPYERLMTRMFIPLSSRCWTTQSIAAITWLHVDAAVGVADLHREDPRVGGHAAVPAGLAVVAADDPGHERAVAVRVEVLR